MRRSAARTATTGILLLVALVLSGCGLLPHRTPVVDGDHGSDGTQPAGAFATDDRAGLDRFYSQHLSWAHCAPSTQCAEFRAPMDWWHDDGRSIHLFVARHRATSKPLGALVIDPGGPGASGAQAVAGGLDSMVSPTVAAHYDVIGIDPRGVGYSSAIRCGGTKALDALYYAPTPGSIGSHAWITAQRNRSAAFAASCRQRTGALVDHVDSVSAARDLELLRRVIGAPKLDYLGYSYGTSLGLLYAGMFPSHVGRMVLDGVEDPWYSGSEDVSQGGGFETALDAYLTACLAGSRRAVGASTCPYTGTLADARTAVTGRLAAARIHPLQATDGRPLTDAVLATAISEALYSTSEWPRLTRALTAVETGSAGRAMSLADEYYGRDAKGYVDNGNESFLAITCLDYGSFYDLKADAKELARLRASDPVLGPYSAYSDLECAGWKEPPSPFPAPVSAAGAAPILVVGTTRDPATPYPQARAVADRLDSGHLVTLSGDGHTAYRTGSACVDRTVDAYLVRGAVPTKDPHCRS